jgi:hypothetical protein
MAIAATVRALAIVAFYSHTAAADVREYNCLRVVIANARDSDLAIFASR